MNATAVPPCRPGRRPPRPPHPARRRPRSAISEVGFFSAKPCNLVGCPTMELDSLREAFDRVVEKRVLSSTKVQEAIDQIVNEVKQVISKMQMMDTDSMDSCDHSSILAELKAKLNEMVTLNQLEGCQKELNVALSKYLKGLFDLGDSFVHECGESDETYLKLPFQEMYGILEAMKARNLEPALTWAANNHDKLLQNSSMLELKLHSLQFVEILTKGRRDDALQYARTHLVPFASLHKAEIQKLMACLIWVDRLEQSPYAEFVSSTHWEKLAEELIHQFCSLLGQPSDSPLSVTVSAGFQGLPTLLKLTTVMAAKKQEWQTMKQLPVPIDIGPEFQYHSVFVCPVLREQSSDENPPMLMPCGHAVSKQSITKLSKSSSRPFKCPYCPSEAVASQCKQLHF
ncbi:hypothetical protein ZWY2020_002640 [Hordeum vulgare]|nr:hypothetical protein ZWY2020_002640 [Hordeum vulgare]